MQEEAREEVRWLSALGPPPSPRTGSWQPRALAAKVLEVTSASRSGAEGWARPVSPNGRSTP